MESTCCSNACIWRFRSCMQGRARRRQVAARLRRAPQPPLSRTLRSTDRNSSLTPPWRPPIFSLSPVRNSIVALLYDAAQDQDFSPRFVRFRIRATNRWGNRGVRSSENAPQCTYGASDRHMRSAVRRAASAAGFATALRRPTHCPFGGAAFRSATFRRRCPLGRRPAATGHRLASRGLACAALRVAALRVVVLRLPALRVVLRRPEPVTAALALPNKRASSSTVACAVLRPDLA